MDASNISIVLDRCLYAGNIGAAARAMKTMGLSDLRLVQPANFPAREADYRAAAATDVLEQATLHPDIPAALSDCDLVIATSARRRSRSLPMLALRDFCQLLSRLDYRRAAWLFGKEDSGLDEQAMLRAHYHVFIPSSEVYPVLNLAMCVQIVCYELNQALSLSITSLDHADHYAVNSNKSELYATGAELEALYQHLHQVAQQSGFLHPQRPMHLQEKLRLLFQRARLRHNEAQILRGLLAACQRQMN